MGNEEHCHRTMDVAVFASGARPQDSHPSRCRHRNEGVCSCTNGSMQEGLRCARGIEQAYSRSEATQPHPHKPGRHTSRKGKVRERHRAGALVALKLHSHQHKPGRHTNGATSMSAWEGFRSMWEVGECRMEATSVWKSHV